MTRLFTVSAFPRWRARGRTCRATDALRPSAGSTTSATSVLTHAPIRAILLALPCEPDGGAGLRPAPSPRPARGRFESNRGGAPCSLLAELAPVGRRHAPESRRCVPFGSPHHRLPVGAHGDVDTSITQRRASAWSRLWTPTLGYRRLRVEEMSPAALLQSTVEGAPASRCDFRSARAEPPPVESAPLCPTTLRGQVLLRRRETPVAPWFRRTGLG
jgi:hypothetical protein